MDTGKVQEIEGLFKKHVRIADDNFLGMKLY